MIDMSSNMMYHLGNLDRVNTRISYQMSTGKNQEKGSEDSLLHNDILRIQDKLRVTESLELQLAKSNALNDSADTSMSDMKKAIDAIKVDLMKGLNDGMDRNDRLALATNLTGIRETMFDLMNVEVDGEYVFAGSNTTIQTITKDANFEDNGKISFNGDAFLRKIAVQPGSYRDRGATGYDIGFYSASSARSTERLYVADNERVIDSEGYEWKISEDKTKLQRYDHNGDIFHPPVEIGMKNTEAPAFKVNLGVGTNTDASGDFSITVNGKTYTHTADGVGADDDAQSIFNTLQPLLTADGYAVSPLTGDTFSISTLSGNPDIQVDVTDQNTSTSTTDTNTNYSMVIMNEEEASSDEQAKHATFYATIPNQITTSSGEVIELTHMRFESKHNYFDDLNVIINALEGYSTKLDGTKGYEMTDDGVDESLRNGLTQTTNQFDATNIGHGELGGRNAVFEQSFEKIQAQITHYDILMQETNGADLAKLAMESKALELTYSSLYSTIAKMNQMSLVNYIN